jgi:hypothetical protein
MKESRAKGGGSHYELSLLATQHFIGVEGNTQALTQWNCSQAWVHPGHNVIPRSTAYPTTVLG